MRKKIVISLILFSIISLFVGTVYGAGVDEVISAMGETSQINSGDSDSGIANSIKDVIGMLQVAGTGIALVVITMLGIKYMLAAPSEKADVKKQIMPILIGCVLIFGAITIVSAITDFSAVIDSAAG